MYYVIAFPIYFIALAATWVIVLVIYNLIFEPFDFGPLGLFVAKSAILLGIISAMYLIPYVKWGSLVVWWIGLMILFKKDFWECRILVFLIWGISFGMWLLMTGVLISMQSE